MKLIEKYKHGVIVLLLWLFAPLAWYLMWKDKRYHNWFPPLLLINGLVFSIILITQTVLVLPQLERIYEKFSIKIPSSISPLILIILLLIVVVQVMYGVWLRGHYKGNKGFVERHIHFIIGFFTFDVVVSFLTGILSFLLPII